MKVARAVALLGALALGSTLAACGASSASSSAGTVHASAVPVNEAVPAGTTLKIAEQFGTISLPLKLSGQSTKLGFTPSYADFTGGPAVTQALEAGAVDLGVLGDVPTVLPQAAHSDLVAIAALRNSGKTYGIVSAPGVSIASVAALRGKKVAYTEGTGPQGVLLSALKNAGLSSKDVTLVNIQEQKDVTAALQSHSVDAAALTDPIIPQYLAQNPTAKLVLRSSTPATTTGLTYLITTTKVLQNPAKVAAIASFLTHDVAAQQWVNTHQAAWVQAYYVGEENLTTAVGTATLADQGPTTFPQLNAALFAQQQKVADLLSSNGVIPSPVNATQEFDTRFNAVLAAAAAGG